MATSPPRFDEAFAAQFAELLAWRRDVRRFRRDALPEGLVERLLAQAELSPSVGHSQPWRWVRVSDPAEREAAQKSFQRCNADALADFEGERARLYATLKLEGMREAPEQIAVFCDHGTAQGHGLGRKTMPEMLDYSVVAAIAQFWLAARVQGVGVGWVSILEPEVVREALGAPPEWKLIAWLCVGWPEAQSEVPELVRAGWEPGRLPARPQTR
ncbi:MAG: 5,6-dimethylbenzimidazole synthase [Bosea sp. (in: a-proteobacteria)]|uniref:5,6-dimethylbenzimidazole synthase n=1 Tax=Bosea sp. (in: a-proteobacteria) TaxID=1871050 RepID=UPI00273686E9|nr:5,6-dimethylbenzimidazole synthase [Bosea sp. (in: a-proteobacteria)]MDP3257348.1 5,6-dimethylbenzimidazole synthase [Bosea sp. (in: a-proteobacteria)]MDP3317623.1 5,6-dimethylbenzimidazole synthase [Bosea sp. (in: a-proteobacteria)]